MASETFDYRYFINAPIRDVYQHLAEPSSYVGLSPLVVEVRDVEHGTDAEGRPCVAYLSVERFQFLGFIRYDNPIRVTTILTQPPQQLVSRVTSPLRVKLRFTFDFALGDGGTWVQETVSAQMPAPLKGFVVSEAKRVQQERARILKQRMETF